jgi:hypothetical protein
MELESAARRVDDVGAELVEMATHLTSVQPTAAHFGAGGSVGVGGSGGAGGSGALGELGRALAGQVSGAVSARAAEATALAGAASALAATVAHATSAYRDADDRRGGPARSGGA